MKKPFRSCARVVAAVFFFNSLLFAQMSPQWVKTYHAPYMDEGIGCAVDSAGFLYVVGCTAPSDPLVTFNWIVIKYNAATGDTVWTRHYAPPTNSYSNIAMKCAVDNAGNLFVAGGRAVGSTNELFIIKYNSSTGDTIWTRSYAGAMASDCHLDNSGHLFVTGFGGSANRDYLTIKYNASTGDTIWTKLYDGVGHGRDEANGCASDGSGNLYVMGYSFNGSSYNIVTVKYDTDGDTLWTRSSVDTLDSIRYVNGNCVLDLAGNLYIAGMCGVERNSGNRYGLIMKYNPSGDTLWTRRFDGPTPYDAYNSCAVDNAGNVYAVGVHYDNTSDNCLAVHYNTNGTLLDTGTYDGSWHWGDYLIGCAVDRSHNLYAVGMTNSFDSADIIVMKFNAPTTGISRNSTLKRNASLLQVCSGPLTTNAVIRYQTPEARHVTMKIFDQRGRQIATLIDGVVPAGEHETTWHSARFPSGIYLCRVVIDGIIDKTENILLSR
jgi:hypothetical protein